MHTLTLHSNVLATNGLTNTSNLHYARMITPKRVTSGGVHLRGLAPGQHSSEKTPQRGKPLATQCWFQPTRISNPRPIAPVAMS